MGSIYRTLTGGLRRDIALPCLAVWFICLSYGAIPVATGAADANPIAAALAGLLVNARHVPYSLALPDITGTSWRRLLGTHVMNDESVVFALAQDDPATQRA